MWSLGITHPIQGDRLQCLFMTRNQILNTFPRKQAYPACYPNSPRDAYAGLEVSYACLMAEDQRISCMEKWLGVDTDLKGTSNYASKISAAGGWLSLQLTFSQKRHNILSSKILSHYPSRCQMCQIRKDARRALGAKGNGRRVRAEITPPPPPPFSHKNTPLQLNAASMV